MEQGFCPGCEGRGEAGSPCEQKACTRLGYHFIPPAYYKPATRAAADPVIGRRVDEYLMVAKLGSGGFGSVYLALQQPINLKTALKLIHDSLEGHPQAKAMLAKFRSEAEALAALNHPNIVRLLKYGTFDWRPYMVMEFVEGQSLRKLVHDAQKKGERLPADVIDHVVVQLLRALAAAHASQIVHRDIKPENILLQDTVGDPHFVRVVDFGLAKFVADSHRTSLITGTPDYMAPEQVMGVNISPATDCYSVAVLIYEMWTGQRLYEGTTPEEIFVAKVTPNHDPLAKARKAGLLSPAQLDFLARCLVTDPKARVCSAVDMLAAWTQLHVSGTVAPDATRQQAAAQATQPSTPAVPGPTVRERPVPSQETGEVTAAELAAFKGRRRGTWAVAVVAGIIVLAVAGTFVATRLGSTDRSEPDGRTVAQGADRAAQVRPAPAARNVPETVAKNAPAAKAAPLPPQLSLPSAPGIVAAVPQALPAPPAVPETAGTPSATGSPAAATSPDTASPAGAPAIPAPAATAGSAHLESRPPGADVWCHGKRLGETPIDVDLSGGQPRTVTLRLKGHEPRRVELTPGPPVTVELVKKAAAAEPPVADKGKPHKDGTEKNAVADPSGGKQGDAEAESVTVVVDSDPPDAVVTADGHKLGNTPVKIVLAAGESRRVTVSRAGYRTATVTVSAGGKKKVTVPLEADSW